MIQHCGDANRDIDNLLEHATDWIELAEKADAMAAYYESRGEYSGVERHKALSYRRTAKSLELGRDTGLPHCSCCLKPMADHYR